MVTTWRAEASSQVQADVDELISAALEHAKGELAKHGEFHPFGAKILLDGTVKAFAAHDLPLGGAPKTLDLRALLRAALQRKRDHLRAAAVVALDTTGGHRVVELDVDHSGGPALAVRVPYERGFFGRKVTFGEPELVPSAHYIWAATAGE